jgi:mannose-6-phosphate isomerase-like protein (cupin superfamily)
VSTERAAPVVRRAEQVPARRLGPGVGVCELLNDQHGCRGLHQRRLRLAGGAAPSGGSLSGAALSGGSLSGGSLSGGSLNGGSLNGAAGGRGEAWYVISGSGAVEVDGSGIVGLEPGTAVWMKGPLRYRCQAEAGEVLEVVAVTVRAAAPEEGDGAPALCVATLDACAPERTGDREFRVLLSAGLSFTQFAGLIPPGRAPAHHHTYDEVVHVLAGRGVVHLSGTSAEIGPGTSVYLPPYQPHGLENTGPGPLEVLGVFYPAGSPAAKRAC